MNSDQNEKLGQYDLVYLVFRSSCDYLGLLCCQMSVKCVRSHPQLCLSLCLPVC